MMEDDPYAQYRHSYPSKTTTLKKKDKLHKFTLPIHFKPFAIMGSGAYGVVCAASDESVTNAKNQREKCVAIKKIKQDSCSKILLIRILRQMKILRNLKSKNIVKLKSIVLPESREKFNDLYLVFELLDSDLAETIKSKALTPTHIKYFITRIIEGMKQLHSNGILHRDLKPRNILVTKDCDLRICDFGLSRVVMDRNQNLTDYVTTRWYRAPELLLGFNDYTEKVDIWSIGCMLAQMIIEKPLFPGMTDQQQWDYIAAALGFHLKDFQCFGPDTQQYLFSYFKMERMGDMSMLDNKDPVGADLVKRMLRINPSQRISLQQALMHPYINQFRDLNNQNTMVPPINKNQFQFENPSLQLSNQQLKDMIYEQILLYNYPKFAQEYNQKKLTGQSLISHILLKKNEEMQEQF